MIHIDQESDYVPKQLISRSAAAVTVTIIISVVATIALAGGRVVETIHVATAPPDRVEMMPFEAPTEAELLRARAEQHLQRYGWVDPQTGIAHVPLDVAIDYYLGASR